MNKQGIKEMKKQSKKDDKETFQLDGSEVALIYEALKIQEKKVREEMFYRAEHPRVFYEIYLRRYGKLLNDFSGKPRAVLKEWKFEQ